MGGSGLFEFLERASKSRRYADLRGAILDAGGLVIDAPAWGMRRLSRRVETVDIDARWMPDSFVARYEAACHWMDPLLRVALDEHIAVHNLNASARWDTAHVYRELLDAYGVQHTILAPVVGDGAVVMTLHFGRPRGSRPFDERDLATACAMAGHVSALLARIDRDGDPPELTERELEVGRLVARGLNNREVARCLAISTNTVKATLKRLFRKLEVDARAEMAARMAAAGLLD